MDSMISKFFKASKPAWDIIRDILLFALGALLVGFNQWRAVSTDMLVLLAVGAHIVC